MITYGARRGAVQFTFTAVIAIASILLTRSTLALCDASMLFDSRGPESCPRLADFVQILPTLSEITNRVYLDRPLVTK